jgi:hypothetical protein
VPIQIVYRASNCGRCTKEFVLANFPFRRLVVLPKLVVGVSNNFALLTSAAQVVDVIMRLHNFAPFVR